MGRNQTSYKCGPNGPLKDWERERFALKARKEFGLGKYDGRYPDHSEEILKAMPCSVMQMYKQGLCGGLSYIALWTRTQTLHECGWVHIQAYERPQTNGPYQIVYAAGPGVDAKRPYDDAFRDPMPAPPAVLNPNRRANPFDALLGYEA